MSTRGTIRLDATQISVVVTCEDCPHWSAFQFTRLEAWRSAAGHEERCHPGSKQAREALRYFATRR